MNTDGVFVIGTFLRRSSTFEPNSPPKTPN